MIKTTITCDVCGREIPNGEPRWNLMANVQNAYMDVTTDGKDKFTRWDDLCVPDVCKECMQEIARKMHGSIKVF